MTKSTDPTEGELLRGVHDHRAQVDLLIENNFVGPSSALQVVDYVPATLEFLGCATAGLDNSAAGTEEYALSGRLNESAFTFTTPGGVTSACVNPSSVDTQTIDPPGDLPLGVYTVVTWDTAALAAATGTPLAGDGALSAGERVVLSYAVGVPQRANTDATTGAFASPSLTQIANLDNNTGASTIEGDAAEQQATNAAVLSGSYDDPNTAGGAQTYTASGSSTVSLEDVSIHKSVDTDTIAQGGTSVWTLVVETSEYTSSATSISVTDTVPDGLEVVGTGGDAGPADSVTELSNGSTVVTWAAINPMTASQTQTLTVTTTTREFYREGFVDDTDNPVRANDAWTNTVELAAQAVDLTGVTRDVQDESSAGQAAGPNTLTKLVSAPAANGTCGDGTLAGMSWQTPASDVAFGPGDHVCWRIDIETPTKPGHHELGAHRLPAGRVRVRHLDHGRRERLHLPGRVGLGGQRVGPVHHLEPVRAGVPGSRHHRLGRDRVQDHRPGRGPAR